MRAHIWMALIGFLLVTIGCIQTQANATPPPENAQNVSVRALNTGLYDKPEIRVKAGQPVEFSFSADPDAACGRQLVIPTFGVNLVSQNGETKTATFLPTKPGTFGYSCAMGMFRGNLIVE